VSQPHDSDELILRLAMASLGDDEGDEIDEAPQRRGPFSDRGTARAGRRRSPLRGRGDADPEPVSGGRRAAETPPGTAPEPAPERGRPEPTHPVADAPPADQARAHVPDVEVPDSEVPDGEVPRSLRAVDTGDLPAFNDRALLDPGPAPSTAPTPPPAAPEPGVDRAERDSLVRRLAESADEVDELRAEIARLSGELAATRDDDRLSVATARAATLDARVAELSGERESLVRRLAESADEVDGLRAESTRLALALEESRAVTSGLERRAGDLDAVQRRVEDLQSEAVRTQQDLAIRDVEVGRLRAELAEATDRAARAVGDLDGLRRGITERDAEREEQRVRAERALAETAQSRDLIRDLEARVSSLLRTLSDREDELVTVTRRAGDVEAVRRTLADRDAEITVLRERIVGVERRCAEEVAELQAALIAAEERHASQVNAIVAEFSSLRRD